MANLKLKFKVDEPASFFHILDSISQWDIYTRIRIREYYEVKAGISKEDKKFIKKYIKIRKKYPWKVLDSDFVPAKDFNEVKRNLKKRLTKKEFGEVNEIINHFYSPIHKIYLEWHKVLEKRKKQLEREVGKFNINTILGEIENFYESNYNHPNIFIHLVINPSKHFSGGGANIRPPIHITIEPLDLYNDKIGIIRHSLPIILHESLHLIESQSPQKKWDEFKKKAESRKLNFSILREAIADTLVPDGFLADKHGLARKSILIYKNSRYPKKDASDLEHYRRMRWKLSAYLYPLTKKQIENKMSLFEGDYIDNCIKEFQKLQKHIKK